MVGLLGLVLAALFGDEFHLLSVAQCIVQHCTDGHCIMDFRLNFQAEDEVDSLVIMFGSVELQYITVLLDVLSGFVAIGDGEGCGI